MTNLGASAGKAFRPSATRLFLFYIAVCVPLFVCIIAIWQRTRIDLRALLIGVASIIPASVIGASVLSFVYRVRITPDGIHAQNAWGLPRFIRWQDIKTVRKFNLPILRWLRLYDGNNSSAVWLIMFQSTPAQFKQEIERLAPPANPVLSHLN